MPHKNWYETSGAKCFYLFENFYLKNKSCIIELSSDEEIDVFYENLKTLGEYFNTKPDVFVYPQEDETRRIYTLFLFLSKKPIQYFILSTDQSINRRTISKEKFETLTLAIGKNYSREKIIDFLHKTGYIRTDFVDDVSQYAIRGEILDVWSIQSENPYRIVFYEDEIESIKEFDIISQRSKTLVTEYTILPAKEYNTDGFLKDYITKDIMYLKSEEIFPEDCFPNINFKGNLGLLTRELKNLRKQQYVVSFFSENTGEQERLLDILEENGLKIDEYKFFVGKLHSGFYSPNKKLAFITYNEIFGKFIKKYRLPKFKQGMSLEGLWEISQGDYVVHEKYGIGKFCGLKQITIGDNTSEYIQIEYKGKDKLYVPVADFHKVQKYIGIEGKRPKLYSLDSSLWERAKIRAKESAFDLANQLYKIYTERKAMRGYSFQEDTEFEKILADSFVYQETADQIKAIEEVKKDMASPYPMDRLILGDVGFGKTEVAIRAAFKCAINSKQAVILAPTTVLAEQHYNVFLERLKSFPVNIVMLTRFQSKKEQKKIINDIKNGTVDIIIGTHRLLQKDVVFKNLGLLIIDEEHRFGVQQKEQIKLLKKSIDVLSLTATPIPRTLSMALSGLKDISLIESPPEGRLPIETHILQYDENLIKKVINFETSRGGQVFYVYNDIRSIPAKKKNLERILPNIKFAFVHGRMRSSEIEKIMWEFTHNKIDCLVSTTIIEAGLDLPNVNTMIVEKAENFGLSQLYQLRGRIGRSKIKAYCYLFFSPGEITESAKKRLYALREFTQLGSGFKLALRDMEIRGAGEILGKKQHGFVQDVGLNLYCKYLSDEISKLKGIPIPPEEKLPLLDITANAYIPDDYIPQEDIRIMFYRRFILAEKEQEISEIINELSDRFGKIPEPIKQLAEIVKTRCLMKKINIQKIKESEKYFEILFSNIDGLNKIPEYFLKNYPDKIEFIPPVNEKDSSFGVRIKKQSDINAQKNALEFIKNILSDIIENCLNI